MSSEVSTRDTFPRCSKSRLLPPAITPGCYRRPPRSWDGRGGPLRRCRSMFGSTRRLTVSSQVGTPRFFEPAADSSVVERSEVERSEVVESAPTGESLRSRGSPRPRPRRRPRRTRSASTSSSRSSLSSTASIASGLSSAAKPTSSKPTSSKPTSSAGSVRSMLPRSDVGDALELPPRPRRPRRRRGRVRPSAESEDAASAVGDGSSSLIKSS